LEGAKGESGLDGLPGERGASGLPGPDGNNNDMVKSIMNPILLINGKGINRLLPLLVKPPM
jgi:hypothetical protein